MNGFENEVVAVTGVGEDLSHTDYLHITPAPRDIANAVMFLSSDEARVITGYNLAVDGGRCLATRGTEPKD